MKNNKLLWLIPVLLLSLVAVYFGFFQVFIDSSSWTASTKAACDSLLDEHRYDGCGSGCVVDCDSSCVLRTFGNLVEYKGTCRRTYDKSVTKTLCALGMSGSTSGGFKGVYDYYDVYGFSEDESYRELRDGCGSGENCQQVTSRSAKCVVEGAGCTPSIVKTCSGYTLVQTEHCSGNSIRFDNSAECGYIPPVDDGDVVDSDDDGVADDGSVVSECVVDSDCPPNDDYNFLCFEGFCIEDSVITVPPDEVVVPPGDTLCSNPRTAVEVCECNPSLDSCKDNPDVVPPVSWLETNLRFVIMGFLALLLLVVVLIVVFNKPKGRKRKRK
jgi:hypothetical protein